MIRYAKPNRVRDMIGLVMLALTALMLWAQTNDRVSGVGTDDEVDVVVVMGADSPELNTEAR